MIPEEKYKRNSFRVDLTRYKIKFPYKYIAPNKSFTCNDIFSGKLFNLCEYGAQICGTLPSLKFLNLLGDERLLIGCNLPIEEADGRQTLIKVLARVRWAQSEAQDGANCHRMGLEFTKISDSDKCALRNYIIRQQLRVAKVNRTLELLNLK